MEKKTKIIIIIVVSVIFLLSLGIGIGIYFLTKKKEPSINTLDLIKSLENTKWLYNLRSVDQYIEISSFNLMPIDKYEKNMKDGIIDKQLNNIFSLTKEKNMSQKITNNDCGSVKTIIQIYLKNGGTMTNTQIVDWFRYDNKIAIITNYINGFNEDSIILLDNKTGKIYSKKEVSKLLRKISK